MESVRSRSLSVGTWSFALAWATAFGRGGFWRGAAEAVCVPLLFTLAGLGGFAALEAAAPAAAAYPRRVPPAETWLVDGFNVVQVALLGGRDRHAWWSGNQRAELLARAEGFEDADTRVLVVFDGTRAAGEDPDARVQSVFAASADDWLVDRVRRDAAPDRLVVVTADRRLAGRARHHGARVASPGEFLGRCRPVAVGGAVTTR